MSHVAPRPSLRRLRSVRAGRSSKPRVVSMRRRAVTRQISGGSAVRHVPRVLLSLTRVVLLYARMLLSLTRVSVRGRHQTDLRGQCGE